MHDLLIREDYRESGNENIGKDGFDLTRTYGGRLKVTITGAVNFIEGYIDSWREDGRNAAGLIGRGTYCVSFYSDIYLSTRPLERWCYYE